MSQTEPVTHNIPEPHQQIYEAINTLLLTVPGIHPGLIPLAAWAREDTDWHSGISISRTVLTKPHGVKTLIGELCQFGVMVWADPVAKE